MLRQSKQGYQAWESPSFYLECNSVPLQLPQVRCVLTECFSLEQETPDGEFILSLPDVRVAVSAFPDPGQITHLVFWPAGTERLIRITPTLANSLESLSRHLGMAAFTPTARIPLPSLRKD